ncbi:MAG: CGNR zinc finger domain-containing protein [Gemmatimonadota bacterium]
MGNRRAEDSSSRGAGSIALIGGHLALDFANTAGWHASEKWSERLADYGELLAWAEHAGALDKSERGALAREAQRNPAGAARALRVVIQLRETVFRVFSALSHGDDPNQADISALHSAHVAALRAAAPRWHPGKRDGRDAEAGIDLAWPARPIDLMRPVHPVMIATASLLARPDIPRLRQCGNHPCGWLFIDSSRSGTRRWCSSAECGNAVRVRKFRESGG